MRAVSSRTRSGQRHAALDRPTSRTPPPQAREAGNRQRRGNRSRRSKPTQFAARPRPSGQCHDFLRLHCRLRPQSHGDDVRRRNPPSRGVFGGSFGSAARHIPQSVRSSFSFPALVDTTAGAIAACSCLRHLPMAGTSDGSRCSTLDRGADSVQGWLFPRSGRSGNHTMVMGAPPMAESSTASPPGRV
jgi:hypothetical protein